MPLRQSLQTAQCRATPCLPSCKAGHGTHHTQNWKSARTQNMRPGSVMRWSPG